MSTPALLSRYDDIAVDGHQRGFGHSHGGCVGLVDKSALGVSSSGTLDIYPFQCPFIQSRCTSQRGIRSYHLFTVRLWFLVFNQSILGSAG